ncbi:MAG: hypothetical protein ACC645_16565 [Pirellulales bacterium]
MTIVTPDIVVQLRSQLMDLECWYVSAGGKHVGSTFSLALGARIPREKPLENSAHPEEFRNYEGEGNLVVWCAWRLDGQDAPESSSDDTNEGIEATLEGLVGSSIVDVVVERPAWDLRLLFSPFHQLRLFCDHVPGDPSFDGNWELHTTKESYYFGPGVSMESESR